MTTAVGQFGGIGWGFAGRELGIDETGIDIEPTVDRDPVMTAPWPPPAPVAVLLPTEEPTLPPTVRYGLPASWEDCVALGLDPLRSDRT